MLNSKPFQIGAAALVVILLIVAGILLVPRLFAGQAPDTAAEPTETVVGGQSVTASAETAEDSAATARAVQTRSAAETAEAATLEALQSATHTPETVVKTAAPPSPRPAGSEEFPGDPPGQDASLRKTGNLREGPGTDTVILAVLDPGTRVRVTAYNASRQWAKVILTNGQTGWVFFGNLEFDS